MAAEPRTHGPPDGPGPADSRASGDTHDEWDGRAPPGRRADRRRDCPRVAYRCGACGEQFTVATPGVAPCPRCQSVGDHDALGPVGGGADGR